MVSIDSIVDLIRSDWNIIIGISVISGYVIKLWQPWWLIVALLLMTIKLFEKLDGKVRTLNPRVPISNRDIAVITGGSKGLGCEMVKLLIEKYDVKKVYILDIVQPTFMHDNIEYYHCNVGNQEALEDTLRGIVKQCNENYESISIFINNTGIRHCKSLLQINQSEVHNLYNVNLFSFIWCLRIIVNNYLTTWNSTNHRLAIITVSSVLGSLAPRNLSIYSSTKAALTQIHEGFALEVREYPQIRPLLVLPGQLNQGMFDDVKPSKQFFAPVVDHTKLAQSILQRVDNCESGVIYKPLYGRFLPLVKILPYTLVKFCRWFSEMDEKVKSE